MLTEHMVKDGVIHAVHARGNREALRLLSDSAALRLTGAGLRPERSHWPLPKDVLQMLQDEDP